MMSVHDLKQQLAGIPGIESLTMQLQGGFIVLEWGENYSATVSAAASDAEICHAVRNAVRFPPVSLIPDKPPAVIPASPPATKDAKPMTSPAPDVASRLQDVMERHVKRLEDMHNVQIALVETALDREFHTVSQGLGAVADRVNARADTFEAMMTRLHNVMG